jgi:phage terminase large subunit GpA-like protein
MVAFTCEKCRRRFTLTVEEMQGYLANSQGKKHALVLCPHCGKANKADPRRLQQALRLSPAVPPGATSTAGSAASPHESEQGSAASAHELGSISAETSASSNEEAQ